MFIKPTQHYTLLESFFFPLHGKLVKVNFENKTVNMLNIWILPKRKASDDREVAAREKKALIHQLKPHLFNCPSSLITQLSDLSGINQWMIVSSDADHSHTSQKTFYKCTSFTLGVYSIKLLKHVVHEVRTDLNIIVRTWLNWAGPTRRVWLDPAEWGSAYALSGIFKYRF